MDRDTRTSLHAVPGAHFVPSVMGIAQTQVSKNEEMKQDAREERDKEEQTSVGCGRRDGRLVYVGHVA